jgi:hypothetical protein
MMKLLFLLLAFVAAVLARTPEQTEALIALYKTIAPCVYARVCDGGTACDLNKVPASEGELAIQECIKPLFMQGCMASK